MIGCRDLELEILAMCRKWLAYLIETLRTLLGIPDKEFTELGTLFTAAETLLVKSRDEAEQASVGRWLR